MTWQPISTAPRDGTLILLCWKQDAQHVMECGWFENAPADRCWYGGNDPCRPTHWQPLPAPPEPACDTAAFLAMMLTAAETGTRVTADDVARLRRLADWADAAPPAGWNGTLDRGETQRAVDAARARLA